MKEEETPEWLIEYSKEHPIDDPISSIGEIVFSFQLLENRFYDLFESLLQENDKILRDIIHAELAFKNIIRICDSLIREKITDDELIKKYIEIANKSKVVEEERNRYLHSVYEVSNWDGDKIGYERRKVRNDKGIKISIEYISDKNVFISVVTEIIRINEEMDGLINNIEQYMRR